MNSSHLGPPSARGLSLTVLSGWKTYHSLHQKDTFTAGLAVEQPIGLLRLRKLPAVGEQMLHGNLAIDDEARAIPLDGRGEGPGAHDGELLAQHVRAHLQ